MKKNFLGILVLLIVALGALYLVSHNGTTAKPAQTASSTPSTLPQTGAYKESTAAYTIAANYATATPLTGSANTTAVALMQEFVSDTITEFKSTATDNPLPQPETLQITYLIGSSAHTLSYIFTVYEDTGGAHGNTTFKTFVFDSKTGAPLGLSDLFTSRADYLGTLSTLSRQMLPPALGDQADSQFITDGTKPEDDSFQDFFFDNTDFVILFPPYQVAPYSAGPITLRIPSSQLGTILKPTYP